MDAHMHLIKCMLQFAGINNTVEKQKLFQTLTAVCFANETSVNMVIDTPPTSPRSVDVSKSNTIDVSTSPKTIDVSSNTNVSLSPAPIQESTEDIKGDRIKINKKDKKKKIKKTEKQKCNEVGCSNFIGDRKEHVSVVVGEKKYNFCASSHFIDEDFRKTWKNIFETELARYSPTTIKRQCQVDKCPESVCSAFYLTCVKSPTEKDKIFQPIFFCGLPHLLDFVKCYQSKSSWSAFVSSIPLAERSTLPKVVKLQ